jgi:hypothetical protein
MGKFINVRFACIYAGVNSSSGCNVVYRGASPPPERMKTEGVNALNFLEGVSRGASPPPERDKTAGANCFLGQANAFSKESRIRWRMRRGEMQ